MIISELIEHLERQKEKHGDVTVTMTGSFLKDGFSVSGSKALPDVFESTVERFVHVLDGGCLGKRIRLDWRGA